MQSVSRSLGKLSSSPQVHALLAASVLNCLFGLPNCLRPDGIDPAAVRISGDVLGLTALWAVCEVRQLGLAWRVPLRAACAILIVYQVDSALCVVLTRQAPVLYDQWFLLRHLGVLLSDLCGRWLLPAGLGVLLVVGIVVSWVRRLLRVIAPALLPAQRSRTLRAASLLALAVVTLSAVPAAATGGAPIIHWLVPELARSVRESYGLWHGVEHGLRASPYRDYGKLALRRKPRVLFFFVESYGRVITQDPAMSDIWRGAVSSMEGDLTRAGWSSASAYSEAPVSAGRSWLAHASVFTGIHVSNEALFQRLSAGKHMQVPNLVGVLRQAGYDTALLAPGDRARPGVHVDNTYGYRRTFGFSELRYQGPYFGWGRVPDQYSLAFANEQVLQPAGTPLFFTFIMVSSHAPWSTAPRRVADAYNLGAYSEQVRRVQANPETPNQPQRGPIEAQLSRYARTRLPGPKRRASANMRAAYATAVAYDLTLIRDQLLGIRGDTLVLVMGDHQPPLVTDESEDFAVPLHVLARDPELLAEFLEHGFVPRLQVPAHAAAAVKHEGLLSLLMRALARANGISPLPPYLPGGQRLDD